jgi:CheY-like chemotaxis protein/nitrogen-specific signal transduction histidine kinase
MATPTTLAKPEPSAAVEGSPADLERNQRQAQKMEALGTLAGGIAHDFNNILAAILGAAEMIHLQLEPSSPARPALEIIYQAGRRARELNKQILAFSRKGKEERVAFDLSKLLLETLRLLRSTLPKNVAILAQVTPGLWSIGEANQIHQVIMNLAVNGFHAMGNEPGKLELELREATLAAGDPALPGGLPPGRYAIFSVRDSGCGMAPEVLEKIFEPFFTTKAVREGTGLGLAVVHGIVHKHEGTILVTSEPGQGSTFQVLLPATAAEAAPAASSPQGAIQGVERILLVDDEDFLTALAKQGLQELGYEVTAKTSANDALAAFRADPAAFDLLLTDLAMPDLSGSSLAASVRSIRPDLPCILMTGAFQEANATLMNSVLFDEIVFKPQVPTDLARAIRRVLETRLQRGAQATLAKPLPGPRKPATVLLVEDNRETRAMLRASLHKGGFEVREAKDGQEAWELYLAAPDPSIFSLLMTDLIMPRMDGLELVSKIRQCDPNLPVLVLSSSDDPDDLSSAQDLQVNEYLSKPFDAKGLVERVRHYLAEGQG